MINYPKQKILFAKFFFILSFMSVLEVRLRVGPYRLGWVEVGLSRLVADLR